MRISRVLSVAAVVVAAASPLSAQRLLVREPSHYLEYGYGHSSWTTFSGYFNSAFGTSNISTAAAVTPGGLAGYSALMLTLPNLPDAPYVLTASEQTEITAFLNGGGRLYVFGENDSWNTWNNNIAGLVGATVGGSYSGNATANFNTGILAGVGTVSYPAGGAFTSIGGGTPLFNTNVAALFGPTQNALFILDVNLCDDSNIGTLGNRQFCQNITGYLAGTIPPVTPVVPNVAPEPASLALVGGGLLGVGLLRRRRARV